MDEYLRQLSRAAAIDPAAKEVLQKTCERSGLIGPYIAEACHLLARLFRIFVRDEFQARVSSFVNELAEVSWRTETSVFDREANFNIRRIIEAIQNADWQDVEIDPDRYIRPLLELYLFASRDQYSDEQYPIYYHQGVRGVILRRDTPKEFISLLNSIAGPDTIYGEKTKQLAGVVEELEKDSVDVWYTTHPTELADVAENFLPPPLYEKLEDEASFSDQQLGDYLYENYISWFLPAMEDGYRSYVYSEMYEKFFSQVEDITWESGAVAIPLRGAEDSNIGTVLIWISFEDLVAYIKTHTQDYYSRWIFDDILEDLDEYHIYFDDRYHGTDEKRLRESLQELAPKKFNKYFSKAY